MAEGWKYSNFGLISTSAPHEDADLGSLGERPFSTAFFPRGGVNPLYIQYTSHFDCGEETQWWYCIKDDVFDLSVLKAKRRYEINKGIKNFEVRVMDPTEHLTEINEIREKLFAQYPEEYKAHNNANGVEKTYKTRVGRWITIGAFQNGILRGYLDAEVKNMWIDFTRMCVDPDFEKLGINFALVYNLLMQCKPYIEKGYYLCDGARTIRHKTAFQDWLIKYFGFRKAYCKLHIICPPFISMIFSMCRPLKSLLSKTHNKYLYNAYCFLRMNEISKQ